MDHAQFIGRDYPPFSIPVEKERLLAFARATGVSDPIYTDEEAARRAGFRALPALPTFAYSITMDAGQSFNVLADMGVPMTRAVHGGQGFTFRAPICAGDVITGQQRVKNVYHKKNGALVFVETEIALTNQRAEPVCDLRSTIVVRNG
jgi:acyl dehydratase